MGKPSCPICGSPNTFFIGWRYRKGYKVRYAMCKSCGSMFQTQRVPLGGQSVG